MDRLAICQSLRNYALFGSNSAQGVKYNKIFPTIDLLTSFLYSQESVKFSVKFGAGVPKDQYGFAEKLREKMADVWEDTGTDSLFGEAVFWSLVYNSYLIKTINNGGIRTYPVNPHLISVYREDIPQIDNQEAIIHLYYTTRSGLYTLTRILGAKKQKKIMERVSTLGPIDESVAPQTVSQIIAAGQMPNVRGVVENAWQTRYEYRAQPNPELVEMREVWVYDDELEDYRVFTRANPGIIIFDRPGEQLCYKGEHPFVKVTPLPLPDYFWGVSLVQHLIGLQDWHDGHLTRTDQIFRKKVRPPRTFTGPGWGSITDERMLALDREGGHFNSSVPGAKMEQYPPLIAITECIEWLHELDTYFHEMAGLAGNVMRAQGDENVRAMQHAQLLQRMGSSRIKKQVLTIQNPAEKLATLMLKMHAEHDKNKYLDEEGKEFYLSQVNDDYRVKVSGHSLSAVFIDDTKQEAKQLVGMKAMTRKRYLQETQPPMEQELERDLEKIEAGEAQQAKVATGLALLKAAKSLK